MLTPSHTRTYRTLEVPVTLRKRYHYEPGILVRIVGWSKDDEWFFVEMPDKRKGWIHTGTLGCFHYL